MKTTVTAEQQAHIEAAQHILDIACNTDYFSDWCDRKNTRATHRALKEAALELLAEQYPDVDVKISVFKDSDWVDIDCVAKLPSATGDGNEQVAET